MSDNPGPQPEPTAEQPQLAPGGVDAVVQDEDAEHGHTPGGPATRDLPPEDNPAVEDAMPDEISQPDDKQQEGDTSGPEDREEEGDKESP